jgi:hypothetical protein
MWAMIFMPSEMLKVVSFSMSGIHLESVYSGN